MFIELKLNFSSTAVLLIACVWTTFFRLYGKTEFFSSPQQRFIITLTVFRFFNLREALQYVAPGPDEKDANVNFLPQKNSSELKFVLQFTVTFP